MIVGCGSKSGRDKGVYFARIPSVITNQGEEAVKREANALDFCD